MIFDPKRLFLLDGIGALITATLLIALLSNFESTFGVPPTVLYTLAGIAIVFGIYSLTCYLKLRDHWQPFLRAIAMGNLSYCILTVFLLVVFAPEITIFGVAYFVAEILIVSSLAAYELITVRRGVDQ